MKNLWAWLLAVPVIILAVIGWWWYGRVKPAPIEHIPPNPPGMTLSQTSLMGLNQGKEIWEVKAGRIWRSLDGLTTTFENVHSGSILNEEEVVHFQAPLARLDQIHQMMAVQGGIRGSLKEGSFYAPSAQIDLIQMIMTSPGKFKFSYNDLSVTADSLRADLNKNILYLTGNVHLKDGSQFWTGKELDYYLDEKTYQLTGDTKVEMNL